MGTMGMRTIIAVSLLFVAASAQAATNTWIGTGPALDFWDTQNSWFLSNPPSVSDNIDCITNANTKTIQLDSDDVNFFPATLTISNLLVGGPIGTINTLSLSNAGTVTPLRIFTACTITNGGVLQITNSFLRMDSVSNGTFEVDGTLRVLAGAKVLLKTMLVRSGATLQIAAGSNANPVVVSNNLTVAGTLNVTDGGGFSNTTYTLISYGGALANNGLTLGSMPTNFSGVLDTSIAGQINVVVSNVTPATARFTASPISNTAPLTVTFTDTSPGVPPLTLTWNLGDSTTNTAGGATFPHTYAAGTYTVSLTASNAFGVSTLVSNNLITAIAPVLTPFQAWQLQYFSCTNCPQAQPDADPIGKGISNTNQFLLGLNPTNSASVFRITSITRTNSTDIMITWATAGIRTNAVDAVNPGPNGYTTNGLQDISGHIIINTPGDTTTNYLDLGGATNATPRFYRIRLVPPLVPM